MNEVYRYTGYSKQAFHQKMDRQLLQREQEELLVPIICELRAEHPGVAARQLYRILRPEHMGREALSGSVLSTACAWSGRGPSSAPPTAAGWCGL